MTPTSIVRLNLDMWLAKSCGLVTSAEGFAYTHRVQYKKIVVRAGEERIGTLPQYRYYTFAMHKT